MSAINHEAFELKEYKRICTNQSDQIAELENRCKMLDQQLYHCGMANREMREEISSLKSQLEQANKARADFLWPFEDESIAEAAYEFANGKTQEYQKEWFDILTIRITKAALERSRS